MACLRFWHHHGPLIVSLIPKTAILIFLLDILHFSVCGGQVFFCVWHTGRPEMSWMAHLDLDLINMLKHSLPVPRFTTVGMGIFVVLPTPSCPPAFPPQHITLPLSRAHVCQYPAVREIAVGAANNEKSDLGLNHTPPVPRFCILSYVNLQRVDRATGLCLLLRNSNSKVSVSGSKTWTYSRRIFCW
jgi:hypothetical protein